jgi:hypothetical protein
MDESFSPAIFVYGMALVLGVGKAFMLLIWRTLARPMPGLRQDLREAWHRRTGRTSRNGTAGHQPVEPFRQAPASEAPVDVRQP